MSVVKKEQTSIAHAVNSLQLSEIGKAVRAIADRSGAICLAGLGKSGLVCKKLVATFLSLGVKAHFLHAADAMHGDLGLLDCKDTLIAVSHSGETEELLRLVAYAKSLGTFVISISGNRSSTLASVADVPIIYKIDEESCHLNLAPTTSTTIQMMIGHALAVTEAYTKGFKATDFTQFHPSGNLGKRLHMKVADLNLSLSATLNKSVTVYAVAEQMTKANAGLAIIVDDNGHLYGVVTDGDLRRYHLLDHAEIQMESIGNICTRNPQCILESESLYKALEIMRSQQIGSLVVTCLNGLPVGSISMQQIEAAISS